jgi:hypothetical protein
VAHSDTHQAHPGWCKADQPPAPATDAHKQTGPGELITAPNTWSRYQSAIRAHPCRADLRMAWSQHLAVRLGEASARLQAGERNERRAEPNTADRPSSQVLASNKAALMRTRLAVYRDPGIKQGCAQADEMHSKCDKFGKLRSTGVTNISTVTLQIRSERLATCRHRRPCVGDRLDSPVGKVSRS